VLRLVYKYSTAFRDLQKIAVAVQFSWATSDLWLIQQNKFYWISHRSMVAQLNCSYQNCYQRVD